jgi:SAM-dependent methyltransferase
MSLTKLPEHLGGHLDRVHTDRITLLHLKEKYNIKTMIDVGCGPGDMVQIATDRNIDAYGIDGDFTLKNRWESLGINVKLFDFRDGIPTLEQDEFDLGWSVEFLEHVDEEYSDNYMRVFAKCKYVVCTAAPPGYPGHHHVNCQDMNYWINKFSQYGFDFDEKETNYIRENSGMIKPFMQKTGMFFVRK